jgi:hypothetical protein
LSAEAVLVIMSKGRRRVYQPWAGLTARQHNR